MQVVRGAKTVLPSRSIRRLVSWASIVLTSPTRQVILPVAKPVMKDAGSSSHFIGLLVKNRSSLFQYIQRRQLSSFVFFERVLKWEAI